MNFERVGRSRLFILSHAHDLLHLYRFLSGRDMHLTRFSFLLLAYACSAVFAVGETFAATNKAKESAPVLVVTTPATPNPEQGQNPASRHVRKSGAPPAAPERRPEAVQKQARQAPAESKLQDAKSHRGVKVNKKMGPKAVVQPRTDLMYHGLLEDSQRYDPRPNYRTAGVPDPQTPDLTHDHFQELDRNRDGKIDPVERTLGRLDMEHDLSSLQR